MNPLTMVFGAGALTALAAGWQRVKGVLGRIRACTRCGAVYADKPEKTT